MREKGPMLQPHFVGSALEVHENHGTHDLHIAFASLEPIADLLNTQFR
ncbi:MAG TPA: hypothetical protein PKX69_11470 [Limnochordia bacterium]|nr:hypothetical protein [Limnochordia bacterium]HPP73350.1 hypothetical protein [Limnochordia bacterium]HPU65733.1 hypothetical protein [Limnochordia bacterium]